MSARRKTTAAFTTSLMFLVPAAALAVCVALVNSPFVVKGVVASPQFGAAVGCQGDNGWAGVAARSFIQIGGATGDPTKIPRLFLAGHGSPLDTFYLGVHIPFDPDMRRKDRLTVYFDANNSNTLNVGDFALLYEVGPDTPIDAGEDCNRSPGYQALYRYDPSRPGGWSNPISPIPDIISRFAYDYDDSDPESKLWELEIAIPRAKAGLNPAGFRLGAKLYPHEEVVGDVYQTWIWPEGLTGQTDPMAYFPEDGGVTAANMAFVDFTACADVVIERISATDPYGQNNTFRRPRSNDWQNGILPANLRNNFTATLRFYNPSDPTDHSAVGTQNTGNVEFTIRPWGSGGFLAEQRMISQPVGFSSLGQDSTVSFDWPVTHTEYQGIEPYMNVASGHACLRVNALNFLVNLDPASDVQYRNLTYTQLSTVVDTFLVSTRTPEFRQGGPAIDFVMRGKWNNVPRNASGWTFKIASLDSIRPLKDVGKGYFTFSMLPHEDRRFVVTMSGGRMPINMLTFKLDPQAGGTVGTAGDGLPPLAIPVKEGQQLTFVAQGRVRVLPDSFYNGANGRTNRELARQPFLLRGVAAARHIGAVIGSFDRFQTSFVLGADRSIIVPRGATELSVAVNDIIGQFKDNRDSGFTLYVGVTEPHRLPTRYVNPATAKAGQPAVAEPAANLPMLDIDVFHAVLLNPPEIGVPPPDVSPGQPATTTTAAWFVRPFTYVAYAVYATHPVSECRGCGCARGATKGAVSLSQFFSVTVLGLVLVRRRRRKSRQ